MADVRCMKLDVCIVLHSPHSLASVILIFLNFVSLNTISLFSASVSCLEADSCHNSKQSSPGQISLRIIDHIFTREKISRMISCGNHIDIT